MGRWRTIGATVAVVAALAGCGGDDGDDGEEADATSTTTEATTTEADEPGSDTTEDEETTASSEPTTTTSTAPAGPTTTLPDRPIDVLLSAEEVGEGFTPLPPVEVNPEDVCDRTSDPSTVQEGVLAVDGSFQGIDDQVVYQAITWYEDAAQAEAVFAEAVEIMAGCDGYDTALPVTGDPARWEVRPSELGATFGDRTAAWTGRFGPPDYGIVGTWAYVQAGAVVMSLNTGILGAAGASTPPEATAALLETALAKL